MVEATGSEETDPLAEADLVHLRRCVDLAASAVDGGGSVLVAAAGEVLAEERDRVGTGDPTQHPDFALARWAATNLTPAERVTATVYTSGEHCPMCVAAHGWVGLGRIVYAASSAQLVGWLAELDVASSPVRALPIHEIAPHIVVDGPEPTVATQVRALHARFHAARPAGG